MRGEMGKETPKKRWIQTYFMTSHTTLSSASHKVCYYIYRRAAIIMTRMTTSISSEGQTDKMNYMIQLINSFKSRNLSDILIKHISMTENSMSFMLDRQTDGQSKLYSGCSLIHVNLLQKLQQQPRKSYFPPQRYGQTD